MKKVMTVVLFGALCVPLFAALEQTAQEAPKAQPVQADQQEAKLPFAKHDMHKGAFHKSAMAHHKQMQAQREKMEKLVADYKGMEDGKAKDSKRKEIEKEIGAIYDKRLEFKEKQLEEFSKRLDKMKADLRKEKKEKKNWVSDKTEKVIENDGKMCVLFAPKGKMDEMPGPRKGFFKKGPHMGGPKPGPRFHGGDKGKLPPPPDAEIPEKPVPSVEK